MTSRERNIRIVVVTVSDRASRGQYEDQSGPLTESIICRYLHDKGYQVTCERCLVPDEQDRISRLLSTHVTAGADLVVTTGGTGIGPRDVTPEATLAVLDKEIPGIMAAVRARHRNALPAALLSRAVAGVAARTLIANLPGNVKAVPECLEVMLPVIPHALEMIAGEDVHPARAPEPEKL